MTARVPPGDVVPLGGRNGSQTKHNSAHLSPELLSPPRGLDPYSEHVQFPERWRAYLIAHFGSDPDRVAEAFGVTRRAAGKWLSGETGCKGGAVAIAVQLHPKTAPRMLWAAE